MLVISSMHADHLFCMCMQARLHLAARKTQAKHTLVVSTLLADCSTRIASILKMLAVLQSCALVIYKAVNVCECTRLGLGSRAVTVLLRYYTSQEVTAISHSGYAP